MYKWNNGAERIIQSDIPHYYFTSLLGLISANKEVGKSYLERIKNETNAYLKKICGKDFTGDLTLYKMDLAALYRKLRTMDNAAYRLRTGAKVLYYDLDPLNRTIAAIRTIAEDGPVADTEIPRELHGYDDEFCLYAIEKTNEYENDFRNESNITAELFDAVRNGFVNLMTPSGKVAYEENLKRAAHEKAEREKDVAREKIKTLWNEYTDLLKSGKTKDAYSLMEKSNFYRYYGRELGCFKKGLFGMKYNGNATEISAYDVLTELGLNE